jgi:hypothetical protein
MNGNIDDDDLRASSVNDIRIDASSKMGMQIEEETKKEDVTSEDLKRLSEYFQKSKDEIQKV